MITEDEFKFWAGRTYEKASKDLTEESVRYRTVVEAIAERLNQHNDALIAVCGERSKGKSSFAITSALILKHLGLNFDFYNNIFYSSADMEKAIDRITTSERNVFIYDEMIDLGYSREAMTKMNRINKKIFTRLRKHNNIYFFCIPYFRDFDSAFRDRLVTFWVEMLDKNNHMDYDRLFFVSSLQIKRASTVNTDPWGIKKVAEKLAKKRSWVQASNIELMQKFDSFQGFMKTSGVPKIIFDEYNKISKASIVASGVDIKKDLNKKPPEIRYIWKKPDDEE